MTISIAKEGKNEKRRREVAYESRVEHHCHEREVVSLILRGGFISILKGCMRDKLNVMGVPQLHVTREFVAPD